MKIFQYAIALAMTMFLIVPATFAQQDATSAMTEAGATARNLDEGAEIFKTRCSICHKVDRKLIGPSLKGVTERRDTEWLLKFIRNSQEVIQSGDPYAVELYTQYNELEMISNLDLSDDQILNILAYIEQPAPEVAKAPVTSTPPTSTTGGELVSNRNLLTYDKVTWLDYYKYWRAPAIFSVFVLLFMNAGSIVNKIGGHH